MLRAQGFESSESWAWANGHERGRERASRGIVRYGYFLSESIAIYNYFPDMRSLRIRAFE